MVDEGQRLPAFGRQAPVRRTDLLRHRTERTSCLIHDQGAEQLVAPSALVADLNPVVLGCVVRVVHRRDVVDHVGAPAGRHQLGESRTTWLVEGWKRQRVVAVEPEAAHRVSPRRGLARRVNGVLRLRLAGLDQAGDDLQQTGVTALVAQGGCPDDMVKVEHAPQDAHCGSLTERTDALFLRWEPLPPPPR